MEPQISQTKICVIRGKERLKIYRLISFFIIYFIFGQMAFGYYLPKSNIKRVPNTYKGEITDKPADFWWIHWIGRGDLSDYVISNTAQGGWFPMPDSCEYFDGTWDWVWISMDMYSAGMYGLCGEYPANSNQFYNFAAGVWVGALYPSEIEGSDTTWQLNVSKGAYNSDLGGMSVPEMDSAGEVGDISGIGLYFSDQIIPEGRGYPHEGAFLFAQSGTAPQPWQALWPFADTSLNSRRPPDMQLNPAEGDIVSNQDTYGVAGDWIPESDASTIWIRDTGPYDVWGLGIRLEQRTYSFNMPENKDYIYINYKIRNMNPFPLKNVYCGYFMDNDVGSGIPEAGQGAGDDMIGYDTTLNLGYTYDSDAYEPDWVTPAGYIGCVLCETPDDIGFTGFASWSHETDSIIDEDGQDFLKYEKLMDIVFCVSTTPQDVRQLSSSGPYLTLQPDEEVNFTIAIVMGLTLNELNEHAENALIQFQNGYSPQAPLVQNIKAIPKCVNPGNNVVINAFVYDQDGLSEVRADIESPDESHYASMQLYDDGLHNDSLASDHIYGNSWTTSYEGRSYLVDFLAVDVLANTTSVNNGASFTTLGPIIAQDWEIIDEDTIPSPGDSLNIKITLKNNGTAPIYGVKCEVIPLEYIDIPNPIQNFADLSPGETEDETYAIKVLDSSPDVITTLKLKITDSNYGEWEDNIELKITDDNGPFLHYPETLPAYLVAGSGDTIRAMLIDGSGISLAQAIIESPAGNPIATIDLYDDGIHGDEKADDHIYGNVWITPAEEEKFYNVNISTEDGLGNRKEYTNLMEFTTKPFNKTADILVVDDDNYNRPPLGKSKFYETYYTDALGANGYECDVWDVFCYGSPDTSILNQYTIVVWLTGATYSGISYPEEYYNSASFTDDEALDLRLYLKNGGLLFLSSQGIKDFYYYYLNYLGISNVLLDVGSDTILGISGSPIGDGLNFTITGGTGADNQFMQSAIIPSSKGDTILNYKNYEGGGYAGVMMQFSKWAAVTFGFGFEAINSDAMRNEVMHRIIEWLYSTGVEEPDKPETPKRYKLLQNRPNPFNVTTNIKYQVPKLSKISLNIYDITGRLIRTLVDKEEKPGLYIIIWNGKDDRGKKLSSGVYFYKLTAGNFVQIRKLILMR